MKMVSNDKFLKPTPFYVFRKETIIDSYETICKKMANIKIHYALKANAEKEILSLLNEIGSNFEIASIGEFRALMKIDTNPERIICGLPVNTVSWLKEMYKSGCKYYVFDSVSELLKLCDYAPISNKVLIKI